MKVLDDKDLANYPVPRSVAAFYPDSKPFWPTTPAPHRLDKIDQISIVVADLDEAMRWYCRVFGWGPFWPATTKNKLEYKGEVTDVELRIVFTQVGNLEIELMQPISGATPHHDHLKERGEGFLHFRAVSDHIDEVLAHMATLGVNPIFFYKHENQYINVYVNSDQRFGVRAELILNDEALGRLVPTLKFEWHDRGECADESTDRYQI